MKIADNYGLQCITAKGSKYDRHGHPWLKEGFANKLHCWQDYFLKTSF